MKGFSAKHNNYQKVIGIDGRCLLDDNYTGVSEYTVVLIKKLLKDHPNYRYVIFLNSFQSRSAQKKIFWLRKYENVRIKYFHIPNKILNFSLWFFRYPKLDRLLGGVDVFIAPNISFLAVSKKTKFIITVHDLSFERFKETFSWKRRFWHFIINTRQLCLRADEIWTVSLSTKWDLESLYRIAGKKIKVKPLVQNLEAFDEKKFSLKNAESIKKKYNLPDKFILYLGTVEPRKNILLLVKAFEYLRQNKEIDDEYKLVIAGQLGWRYNKILDYIKKSKFVGDILLTNFIEKKEKPYFYRLADVFVYPSLFEGFGIPVVEAMAAQKVIVTSNNSSLPEVIGDAGIMIDPDRVEDLIDALKIAIKDKSVRKHYVERGNKRVKEIVQKSKEISLL